MGPVARRPSPSLRALLFWCGEGAVCEAFGGWKTAQTAIVRRPRLQQGERVKGGITSSKGQEVITSSKGKKQENKREEARSKKQLQATSDKKQETRNQEATSGWKTGQRASFLVDSESNVRQAAGRQLRELVFL